MQNTSDNEEYYNEPTASDWADYMRWREEYDRPKTDEELEFMCHYYEQRKKSIVQHDYHPYYKPFRGEMIELPKLNKIG